MIIVIVYNKRFIVIFLYLLGNFSSRDQRPTRCREPRVPQYYLDANHNTASDTKLLNFK